MTQSPETLATHNDSPDAQEPSERASGDHTEATPDHVENARKMREEIKATQLRYLDEHIKRSTVSGRFYLFGAVVALVVLLAFAFYAEGIAWQPMLLPLTLQIWVWHKNRQSLQRIIAHRNDLATW